MLRNLGIIGKRHKTDVPYQVKLLDVPLQIIKRYRTFPKENPKSVFGEVNYWSVCKKLKTVMKECGIEKSISAHCARHKDFSSCLKVNMLQSCQVA